MAAIMAVGVRLLRRLPRICREIHSSVSVLTLSAWGPALIAVSGDSATVRGGTGRPDSEAA